MDFGSLLHVAQKNGETQKKEVKYYSTKFDPPKKEERSKQLSVNIKKFLARKEAEEKQKAIEAKSKRDELLALRSQDKKATRRVQVMLKRTKSANKSVIQDAVDNDNTAVTLAGPSQPDEDDYGYVSQEASAFYNKMMAKYNRMPEEDKFAKFKKKANGNLNGTKERVRDALLREQEEALQPHRRKRKHESTSEHGLDSDTEPDKSNKAAPKPASKPSAPPPINFSDLLKLAEKKQYEPIVIERKEKPIEEVRPMTKKQKKEYEKEREWLERKEKGLTTAPNPSQNPNQNQNQNGTQQPTFNKIPKKTKPEQKSIVGNTKRIEEVGKIVKKSEDRIKNEGLVKPSTSKVEFEKERNNSIKPTSSSSSSSKTNVKCSKIPLNDMNKMQTMKTKPKYPTELKSKQLPPPPPSPLPQKSQRPSDLKSKQDSNIKFKSKQFPPADLKPKQFPPKDVKRKPIIANKRRILDDDDDEYDSEMDDFIDDGPEGEQDYSKHISEIFGYDKSKYRSEDYDDSKMESSYSQMMREEFISSRIGLLEDLEDIKQEAEEKKRKAQMKKARK